VFTSDEDDGTDTAICTDTATGIDTHGGTPGGDVRAPF
jgi:hypothetical protein